MRKHYLSAQKLSDILSFPMTSPKFKLRNCWFLCVSTFMRYYERLSVNTTDRCARWKNQNHLLQFQKISIRIFNIFFQNYPLNQYYRDFQFYHLSTAEISYWYMAFIRKIVFQRKSNASHINLWNKIFGQFKLRVFTTENIYGTRVIYDLWTCSYIDEYKRELKQHLELWRKFASFPPAKTPKTILDFTVVFFQTEKLLLCESERGGGDGAKGTVALSIPPAF